MISENSKEASYQWTFEYGKSKVAVIHPGNSYNEILCINKDGNGYTFMDIISDQLPTDISEVDENCLFPIK